MPNTKVHYHGSKHGGFIDKTGTKKDRWTYLEIDKSKPIGNGVWWVCKCDCGSIRSRHSRYSSKSCGCLQREIASRNSPFKFRENHPCWKGGRCYSLGGYVRVMQKDHPRANKAGYVAEHILIMERKLGRYISTSETVHHINGTRDDNRPENLELWDKAHPPGQRHLDKMKWHMSELIKKCDRKTLVEFCSELLK